MRRLIILFIAVMVTEIMWAGVECNGDVCTFVPDIKNEHIVVVYEGKSLKCDGEALSKNLNADLLILDTFKPAENSPVKYVFIFTKNKIDTAKYPKHMNMFIVTENSITIDKTKYIITLKEDIDALKKQIGAK